MREILFKAKRTDNGEWTEGYVCRPYSRDDSGNVKSWYFNERDELGFCAECIVSDDTICQYTGLTDATKWENLTEKEQQQFLSEWNYKENRRNQKEDWNGKKIWENDIVAFVDMTSTESGYWERDCCGQVLWDEEEACFHVTNRLSAESYEVLQGCSVIGNVFDNSEIFEQEGY